MENSDDSEVTEGEQRNLKEERLFKLPASLPNVAKRIPNVNQDSMSIEVLQETTDPNKKIQNKEQVIETGSLITQKETIRSEDNDKLIESSKKLNSDEIEKSIEKTAKLKSNAPIPYNEPPWGGHDPPSTGNKEPLYTVEELKNGVIVNQYPLTKSYQVIGRLPICDIQLEHPSLSRYHAVLQFKANSSSDKPAGFYLYDLDSTHGTFHNKHRCFPKTYYRLRVGHGLKFGGSTRLLILQGPLEDSEQESELSVTELKELAILKAKERLYKEQSEQKSSEEEESTGISWGMAEDAVEDEPSTDKNIDPPKNPFLSQKENENIDISDPKKTLRGWFEREGLELEYDCQEVGYAKFKCTVNLPIEDENGISTPKVAEATVSGKKKEAVISCALEACRILDRLGLLRSSTRESRVKRSKKKWEENDYYDSDEDEFLDRTGTLEAKRQKRMNTVKGNQNSEETARLPSKKTVETFDSLCEKRAELSKEILNLEQRIESGKKSMQEMKKSDNGSEEDLDMYMSIIEKSADCSKEGLSKMKIKLSSLASEIKGIERLIEIARPAKLPEKVSTGERCMPNQNDQCDVPKSGVIMIGKMFNRKMGHLKPIPSNSRTTVSTKVNHKHDQGLTYNQEHDDDHIPVDSMAAKGKFKMKIEQEMEVKDPENSKARSEFPAEMAEESKEDKTVVSKNIVNASMKKKQKRKSDTFSNNLNQNVQSNTSDIHEFVQNSDKSHLYEEMSTQDDRYSAWLPPKNQTGDGRTNLNDKFGY